MSRKTKQRILLGCVALAALVLASFSRDPVVTAMVAIVVKFLLH